MKQYFSSAPLGVISLYCLLAMVLLLQPPEAFCQSGTPPPQLPRNLPREVVPSHAVGNKPPAAVLGPAGPMNYVRTYSPRVAITSEGRVLQAPVDSVQVSTTYFDGLGRPVQTVMRQESPLKRDIIQPIGYAK